MHCLHPRIIRAILNPQYQQLALAVGGKTSPVAITVVLRNNEPGTDYCYHRNKANNITANHSCIAATA